MTTGLQMTRNEDDRRLLENMDLGHRPVLRGSRVHPNTFISMNEVKDAVEEIEVIEEEITEKRRCPGRPKVKRCLSLGRADAARMAGYMREDDDDDDSTVIEEVVDDDGFDSVVDEVEYYDSDGDIEEIVLDEEDGYGDGANVVSPEKSEMAPADDDPDLPSREDVAEAINYMIRQEKVIEYGVVTKEQAEKMVSVPLSEMMAIMDHFELCDNNNAPIRWDIVKALVGCEDAPEEAYSDNEDQDKDQSPSKAPALASVDESECEEEEADEFTVRSDFHVHERNNLNNSVGSGFSLDANSHDGHSTGDLTDNSHDGSEYVIEEVEVSDLDPRIRAQYTKSMVELQRNRSSG